MGGPACWQGLWLFSRRHLTLPLRGRSRVPEPAVQRGKRSLGKAGESWGKAPQAKRQARGCMEPRTCNPHRCWEPASSPATWLPPTMLFLPPRGLSSPPKAALLCQLHLRATQDALWGHHVLPARPPCSSVGHSDPKPASSSCPLCPPSNWSAHPERVQRWLGLISLPSDPAPAVPSWSGPFSPPRWAHRVAP